MKRNYVSIAMAVFALDGCVSGAPRLAPEQEGRLATLAVYQPGQAPNREYKLVREISATDCSGAPLGGRVLGNAEKAIETLKQKAAAVNTDAIVNESCAAIPFVNNCWAAKKCTGQAVQFR
jgi:hypothetical protein